MIRCFTMLEEHLYSPNEAVFSAESFIQSSPSSDQVGQPIVSTIPLFLRIICLNIPKYYQSCKAYTVYSKMRNINKKIIRIEYRLTSSWLYLFFVSVRNLKPFCRGIAKPDAIYHKQIQSFLSSFIMTIVHYDLQV